MCFKNWLKLLLIKNRLKVVVVMDSVVDTEDSADTVVVAAVVD